jgi:tetratricopeptide (TPR) repeat protein
MADLLLRQDRTQAAISKLTIVAQTYSARGESNRAKDLYNRIVELSPMDLAARSRLIDQLVMRGETDKAVSEYLKLADVYYRLAEMEIARTTYQRALRLTQQANLDNKWAIQILHHMADIDLQRLDWRQAVRIFEQLRTLDPEDEKARTNLIQLNVRLGQEGQAVAELDNYLTYLVGNAKEESAIPFLENLVKEDTDNVFARRRLAEALQQARRTDEAIEHWDKVGEQMYDAGDLEGAKQAVRAILTMNPANSDQYQTFLQKLESES